MGKKEKHRNNEQIEATFSLYVRTPEGPVPMTPQLMELNREEREYLCLCVSTVLKIMGYDPSFCGLEMYISRIDPEYKRTMIPNIMV